MSDLTAEVTAPGAVCPECYGKRREMSLGSGTIPILTCYCEHSRTAAFWSPVSGWATRSPIGLEEFGAIVDQSIAAATEQLAALRRVQAWVLDRCERKQGMRVSLELLYRDYRAWTHVEGVGTTVSAPDFEIALKRSGVFLEKRSGDVVCHDVRVRSLA